MRNNFISSASEHLDEQTLPYQISLNIAFIIFTLNAISMITRVANTVTVTGRGQRCHAKVPVTRTGGQFHLFFQLVSKSFSMMTTSLSIQRHVRAGPSSRTVAALCGDDQ